MRLALLMSVSMLSLSPALSFAAGCTCTHECMEKCEKGQGENCQCKECDCKKEGNCKDGHCKTKSKESK